MKIKAQKTQIDVRLFILILLVVIFGMIFILRPDLTPNKITQLFIPKPTINKELITSCKRTTRIENIPRYDRALSLIEEKYKIWSEVPSNYGNYFFFPFNLINCIKVIESNVTGETGAEGYFNFNDSKIENDYFPIYVDKSYNQSDDILISLLLVHEITHVRQYLDIQNGKPQQTCLSSEAEAFYALYKFVNYQYDETRKSILLRLEYDDKLNPQLQTYKNIKDAIIPEGIVKPLGNPYISKKSNTNQDEINLITKILSEDVFYKQFCGISNSN